jgi:hypothetical protein
MMTLPGLLLPKTMHDSMLPFRFDGGDGALMALIKPWETHLKPLEIRRPAHGRLPESSPTKVKMYHDD